MGSEKPSDLPQVRPFMDGRCECLQGAVAHGFLGDKKGSGESVGHPMQAVPTLGGFLFC